MVASMLVGYTLAMMMGITLGLIGAGGSILAVPILVYFFEVKPVIATGYSLLIVGCTAMVGATSHWKNGNVHFRKAVVFAMPAMLSVLATRIYIIPAIPDTTLGLSKDNLLMILFSGLMFVVAIMMLKSRTVPNKQKYENHIQPHRLLIGSSLVGFLTGMVGAGGGFLIIPSLMAIFKFNIKEAIGTSLMIIAINSLVGFNGDLATGIPINWPILGVFLTMTILGVLIGAAVGKQMEGSHLRRSFGFFLLVLSTVITIKEIVGIP